jgi:hypothetical protein
MASSSASKGFVEIRWAQPVSKTQIVPMAFAAWTTASVGQGLNVFTTQIVAHPVRSAPPNAKIINASAQPAKAARAALVSWDVIAENETASKEDGHSAMRRL